MHCVRVREGRRPIRGRTLSRARRCLSAVEQSLSPELGGAVALATVMTEMARTDTRLSALLRQLDPRLSPDDAGLLVARCGLDRAARASG